MSDIDDTITIPGRAAEHFGAEQFQCEDCGAPAASDQRYCLSCGAHRKGVPDPASRYFSEASAARTRVAAAAAARTGAPRRARWSPGLLAALLIALIPVGVAVGVTVGRSSNNGDAKLIQALSKERAQEVTASTAGVGHSSKASSNSGGGGGGNGGGSGSGNGGSSKHHHHSSGSKTSSASTGGKAANTPAAPPAVSTTGHVSQTQQQQGEKAVQQIQSKTGQGYVQQENQNTGAIVVP